jgi:ATP-binding cassette subfamily B protein/ATP-binding cassette subfamily C protein/ATP-binding cassette subfamily B multidrug efflux pump
MTDIADHPDLRRIGKQDRRRALSLLYRAARPDRREVVVAALLLGVAGLLEAAGPIFGKRFIDHYLLPRNGDVAAIALLLAGCLASGWVASIIRYFQLVRLAGLSTRSVQRLRRSVYAHALALPMSFFDRAITGQLVSRITNDTEAVKDLYVKVLFEIPGRGHRAVRRPGGDAVARLAADADRAAAGARDDWHRAGLSAAVRRRPLHAHASFAATSTRRWPRASPAWACCRRPARAALRRALRATNDAHYRARLGEVRANAWLLRPRSIS